MSDYKLYIDIFAYSALTGVLIWTLLTVRLFVGIFKNRPSITKSSIKYLVNSTTFVFVAAVYISFAMVVQAPHGQTKDESFDLLFDWVVTESTEWFLWAMVIAFFLTLFNLVYQNKIEKIKNSRQIVLLSLLDMAVMCYGIFIAGQIAFAGLAGEIERQTFK
jgi:uncharacterized protein (DUF2132 family)